MAKLAKEMVGRSAKEDPAETSNRSLMLSGLRGADAFLVRGFVLEYGIHVPRNLSAAADNYRLAAVRGDARGQLWLGLMKAEGRTEDKATTFSAAQTVVPSPKLENPSPLKKP
jgi:TPR repeat protein